MDEERDSPDFSFLFDVNCPEHKYYRWRVYSLAQGDTLGRWRTGPFVMIAGGLRWTPPDPGSRPAGAMTAAAAAATPSSSVAKSAAPHHELTRRLSDDDMDEFEDLLRSMSLERADIEEGMAFALDHADAARDVVDVLTEALTLSETLVPIKVARLFLVSDILHNCSAPVKNASAYRAAFQQKLPRIFESLEETHRSISGRITREAFKKRVSAVLAAWADWFLFSDEYLRGLEATFQRGGLHTAATLPTAEAEQVESEMRALTADEAERTCRARGLVADGGADACVRRLISLETYNRSESSPAGGGAQHAANNNHIRRTATATRTTDGGEATEQPTSSSAGGGPGMSRWTSVTDDEDGDAFKAGVDDSGDHGERAGQDDDDGAADAGRPARNNNTEQLTSAMRESLRRVEVEVLQYREELEEQGGVSAADIEDLVAKKRESLRVNIA